MTVISFGAIAEELSQTLGGPDARLGLAAAVLGLTIALRIVHWQYRARIERRLQAAAAAYAARELAQIGQAESGSVWNA